MKSRTIILYVFALFEVFHLEAQTRAIEKGSIKAGNLNVYYERSGNGEPLLLLHAGLQDHTMWAQQVTTLSKQFEIITPDLPFHGKTTGIDTTLLAKEAIRILLDSLHLQRVSMAGLSMGASVVQDFIIAYPQRVNKSILISAGINGHEKRHPVDSVSMGWYAEFIKAIENKDTVGAAVEFTKAWAEGIYRSKDSLKAPVSKYVYQTTLQNLRAHKLAGWPILQNNPPAIENIAGVKLPILLIDGDKDLPHISVTSEYLQKNIKGAKRVTIKNVAHMLNMEKPEDLNRLILKFFREK